MTNQLKPTYNGFLTHYHRINGGKIYQDNYSDGRILFTAFPEDYVLMNEDISLPYLVALFHVKPRGGKHE